VTELEGCNGLYGSYCVLGNFNIIIPSINAGNNSASGYIRTFDISNRIYATDFRSGGDNFPTSTFCSFQLQVCVYTVQALQELPTLEFSLLNNLVDDKLHDIMCGQGYVRMCGVTQLGRPEGMRYVSIARVASNSALNTSCKHAINVLVITSSGGAKVSEYFR
jgi:alpha-L-fucosidase 2